MEQTLAIRPLPLNFAMSADKTRVTVTPVSPAPQEMTAPELDQLIRALIIGRSGMAPARRSDDAAETSNVLTHSAMAYRLAAEGDGSGHLHLGVFHPGAGWFGLHLRREEALDMVKELTRALHPEATPPR
jgi:L,D-peptidoglycan transpeptidase YkuD (ErfK/YbiS/YcfS/YnhG family)